MKAAKATGTAVSQAKAYAKWVYNNMLEILDESYGYFKGIENPSIYHPAVALVAPSFSSNFDYYIKHILPRFFSRKIQINSAWRKKIKIEFKQDFGQSQR